MGEQLLTVITKYLDKIGSGVETAINYALKEAPDLFQEYLLYRTIEEIHSAVICGVSILISGVFIFLIRKADWDGFEWVVRVTCTVTIAVCFLIGLHSIKTIYQINLTPKAYMIDRVSSYLSCKNQSGQNGNCRL